MDLQVEQVDDRVEQAVITGEAEDRVAMVVEDPAESATAAAGTAPTEENDADAAGQADLEGQGDPALVAQHAPETEADVEADELAATTPEQQRPADVTDPQATEDPEPSA